MSENRGNKTRFARRRVYTELYGIGLVGLKIQILYRRLAFLKV